jgi:hypothetical protein
MFAARIMGIRRVAAAAGSFYSQDSQISDIALCDARFVRVAATQGYFCTPIILRVLLHALTLVP